MRADMTPEEVHAAGIYLNGGRRRGWKQRLAALLDTPEATIAAWATRSPRNARPISGAAAVAIRLLVAMMRQELMVTARPEQAGEALTERLGALLRQPPPLAPEQRSISIETSGPPAGPVQPAPWLGIQRPAQRPRARAVGAAEGDPAASALPFGAGQDRGGARRGRQGSSA